MYVVGVDGCKAGWIAVAMHNGSFAGSACLPSFHAVLEAFEDALAIGVDIPLGLLPESMRVCDALAKKYVGERSASVFLTPPRKALEAETYAEANALCRMLTDRELSRRAYSLRAKILEVEMAITAEESSLARSDRLPLTNKPRRHPARLAAERVETQASLRKVARIIEPDGGRQRQDRDMLPGGRVIEAHPECSFKQMNGEDLHHSKKSYNGMMKRKALLEEAGVVVPKDLGEIGGVAVEDVFDAAAVAWTAHRYAIKKARSLPPRELWQYDGNRAIAIWM